MSMGALSLVMLVWRAMSSTSVRRSTLVPLCMMGTSQTGPGPFMPSKLPHRNRAILW